MAASGRQEHQCLEETLSRKASKHGQAGRWHVGRLILARLWPAAPLRRGCRHLDRSSQTENRPDPPSRLTLNSGQAGTFGPATHLRMAGFMFVLSF